jgi:hypothetical protein
MRVLPIGVLLVGLGVLAGCDTAPTPPPTGVDAEKDDEQRIKAAAAAERKGRGKPAHNPDDD